MSARGCRGVVVLCLGLFSGAAGAAAAPPPIVTGPDWGAPNIRLFDAGGTLLSQFFALDSPQVGGVAVGDMDGDGRNDIVVGAGPGGPPRVTIFSRGGDPQRSLLAYGAGATGGVFVAVGDVTGDGRADLVTGAAAGGSHVRIWNGTNGVERASFFAFDDVKSGGVSVATGDVDGDGKAEVIAGGGFDAGPRVRVFDRDGGFVRGFTAFDPTMKGGVLVAAGDVDGDRRAEIVTGVRDRDGPQVSVFDGTGALRWARSPFPGATTVSVTVGDVTGDGKGEIFAAAVVDGLVRVQAFDAEGNELAVATGDPQWGERVALAAGDLDGDSKADLAISPSSSYSADLRGATVDGRVLTSFRPTEPLFSAGMRVAAGDVDDNGTLDVITAPGYGRRPEIRVFDRVGDLLFRYDAFDPVFRNGVYVAAGDVDGDGTADVVVTPGYGEAVVNVLDGVTGDVLSSFKAYDNFEGALRVAVADLDDDGKAEIVTGAGCCGGPHVQVFDGKGKRIASFFAFDPALPSGVSVAGGDVNGDGHDDVIVGSDDGPARVKIFDGAALPSVLASFTAPDLPGARLGAADLDGDGRAEVIAAGAWGGLVQVFDAAGTRLASFQPYEGFQGGLFVATVLHSFGPVLRNTPPLAPRIHGPRSTKSRRPTYRFSTSDPDGTAAAIRFRCAFDTTRLHRCGAVYRQRLAPGRHVLRAQAIDGDGGVSPVTRFPVLVRRG